MRASTPLLNGGYVHAGRPLRIGLLVDNPNRDLPGLVLTARRLCRLGATVLLIPMNLRNTEIWALAPDLVLLNHFRTIYEDIVRQMLRAGMAVGVLDTEGSVFTDFSKNGQAPVDPGVSARQPVIEEYSLSMARDRRLRHGLSVYCAWTEAFRGCALAAGWYQDRQMVVTGTPRTDFYAGLWRGAACAIAPYVGEYPRPLVLISGNFMLANPRFASPEQEARMMIETFSYGREYVLKWQQAQEAALKGMTALGGYLARRIPQASIVVRPHPFEGTGRYDELLEKLPNLHLDGRGTVDPWLLKAGALIHLCSSTAVEAAVLGAPVFTPGWLPHFLSVPAVEAVSMVSDSPDALVQSLRKVFQGDFTPPPEVKSNVQRVFEDTYYKLDGMAHARVADAVLKAAGRRESKPSQSRCATVYRKNVEAGLGGREDWWDASPKRFSLGQVQSILQAIEQNSPVGEQGGAGGLKLGPAGEAGEYAVRFPGGRTLAMSEAEDPVCLPGAG